MSFKSSRALVDEIILALTVICSSCIIVLTLLSDRRTKLRYRIVLGLIVNDFILGASYLIPLSATLAHRPPIADTPFCTLTAFIGNTAVCTEELWTLSVSVTTYFILVHPLSRVTRFLEHRWIWLCLAVWVVGLVQSLIGAMFVRYSFGGEYCQYSSYKFSEVILFIPKCICFLIATPLYIRLFLFLRRPSGFQQTTSSYQFKEKPSKAQNNKTSTWQPKEACIPEDQDPAPIDPPPAARPSLAQMIRHSTFHLGGKRASEAPRRPPAPPAPWDDIDIRVLLPPGSTWGEEPQRPSMAHIARRASARVIQSTRNLHDCLTTPEHESLQGALNRRVSLLMICLPLANMILFIVSFIRLIHNLSGPPNRVLDALADWTVFGQGIVDALIYGFVEWRIRKGVKKIRMAYDEQGRW